jgi:hypothetical protein
MKSKNGKDIKIGDLLSADKDGVEVTGVLVQANDKTGILLPKDKIGQSAKDVGIEVNLSETTHAS